jgi:hypothetical protein
MKPNNFPLRPSLDGTEELYTQTDGFSQKFTLDDLKAYLEASEWTEVIINVSSAQILSMGKTPIQILPKAGDSKYYIFEGVLEFTAGNLQYDCGVETLFGIYYNNSQNIPGCYFSTDSIESKNSNVIPFSSIPNFGTNNVQNGIAFDDSIFLSTQKGNNPTSGTGTIRIVLRYKVKTFGA